MHQTSIETKCCADASGWRLSMYIVHEAARTVGRGREARGHSFSTIRTRAVRARHGSFRQVSECATQRVSSMLCLAMERANQVVLHTLNMQRWVAYEEEGDGQVD